MKQLFLLLFTFSSPFINAQTESAIRSHYISVNNKITESLKNGFEGPLYSNQWVANKYGRSWPAVGIYTETTDFWYDDPPDHISPTERAPENVLLKVNISRKASHLMTNEEYLYEAGSLIFYYCKEGEEGNEWETRIYFTAKGSMFKSSVKANGKELTAKDYTTDAYKDFKPNSKAVMLNAKKYQELFVKSM